MAYMADGNGVAPSWEDAIALLAIWLGTHQELRHDAVAHELAELAAEDGPAAVKQAALRLVDVAGMFAELYADCAGTSLDTVLREAAEAFRDADD